MNVATRWLRRARKLVGSWSPRVRLACALLAAGILAVGLWAACQGSPVPMAEVLTEPLSADQAAAAAAALEAKGIAIRMSGGKILAPRDQVARCRAVLAYEGLLPRNLVGAFEQLTRQSDMWSTSEQNDKRWQAAKMATLSRLIEQFPPVRAATVIYEPGSPRKLGGAAAEPTASVNVELKPNATMDHKLAVAIADMVSGSVSGMTRRNVRIIDSTGRSHNVSDAGEYAADDQVEQFRSAEAYYLQKLQAALAYVGGVTVSIQLVPSVPIPHCVSASVCLPRSYLLAARMTATAPADVDDESLRQGASGAIAKIQQAAATALGCDSQAVTIDWYAEAQPAVAAAPKAASNTMAMIGFGLLCVAAVGAVSLGLYCVQKLRHARAAAAGPADDDATNSPETQSTLPTQPRQGGLFDFLQDVPDDRLADFLQSEHPQTISMILSQLPPAKSAAILAAFAPARQVELARRIASLEQVDAQVLAQVAASLADRMAESAGRPVQSLGVTAVARILHHAAQGTEQAVLAGLSREHPSLAESIRRQMFVFEDIVQMSPSRLGQALGDFDSEELAVAMRTAGEPLRQKVMTSLPAPAAQRLKEEMERMGPVRLSDVEAAQRHVAQAVWRQSAGQYLSQGQPAENELLA